MQTHYTIKIMQVNEKGNTQELVLDCNIIKNQFDEHDTAGFLFGMEFAANNHSEVPMRVHINEV